MDDVAIAALPELGRGRDFIVRRQGDLVIRVPRTERARDKLARERTLRDVLAPRFPSLVAPPVACALPPPLFAYRYAEGSLVVAPPTAAFVETLADFVARLHAMTDLPMTVDPAPDRVVRRLQAIVRDRFWPRLPEAARAELAPLALGDIPVTDLAPCPQHGDLAARNLLVDDRGELVAILDWSDSVVSDPAIDLGAIAQWAGPGVLDAVLERTGRAGDRSLRTRAVIVGALLAAIDLVHGA